MTLSTFNTTFKPSLFSLNNFFDEIWDELLKDFDNAPFNSSRYDDNYPFYPVMNHYVTKSGNTVLEIAVPGFEKEDIKVEVKQENNDNYLNIDAIKKEKENDEKKYFHHKLAQRSFNNSFKLSNKMDVENLSISLEKGILKIELPIKKEFETKIKQIEIK